MSYEMLRIVMSVSAAFKLRRDNHIITFALQIHNGERSEPHNSKLKKSEDGSSSLFFFPLLIFYLKYAKIFLDGKMCASLCAFCLVKGRCKNGLTRIFRCR